MTTAAAATATAAATYQITQQWNGVALPAADAIHISFSSASTHPSHLQIDVDAPLYNDPKSPTAQPGPVDGLWDYEVVEVFLLGSEQRYLEVEIGPHGHYLALCLQRPRNLLKTLLPLEYTATVDWITRRWRGSLIIPPHYIPPGCEQFNAYAIHGSEPHRIYKSLFPATGFNNPDFHRLQFFQLLEFSMGKLLQQDTAVSEWIGSK